MARGKLTPEQFSDLPLDRNYRSIATLLPQANQSFLGDAVNISGATGLENKYFVDGVDVTGPFAGRTGTDLPYGLAIGYQPPMSVRAGMEISF